VNCERNDVFIFVAMIGHCGGESFCAAKIFSSICRKAAIAKDAVVAFARRRAAQRLMLRPLALSGSATRRFNEHGCMRDHVLAAYS
jgi:hypothetical protein